MNHFIAMNPQRGGNKGSASCLPLAEYDKLIAQPWLHDMVEQIRGGNDKLKGLMPFRCGHYSRFLKNHRSQKDADPTSFLFQTTIDIDDKELVGIAIEMARQLNCSDSIWKGMLLHLEYSARKKLHIDIRMPIGMTIEETQRAYCKALGVPCDESCFTPERILFITDQDSEIYRSKDWYAVLPADELKARREAYLKRGLTIDGRGKANQPYEINIKPSTVNTQQNVQTNRLSGSNGNPAVSHGSAGGYQIPDGLPTSGTASEKSLIAFDRYEGDDYPAAFAMGNDYYAHLIGKESDPLCKNITRLSGRVPMNQIGKLVGLGMIVIVTAFACFIYSCLETIRTEIFTLACVGTSKEVTKTSQYKS